MDILIFFFCASVQMVKGRYIKIVSTTDTGIVATEIQAFSYKNPQVNVLSGKVATQSADYSGLAANLVRASNATDGSFNNFSHSGSGTPTWWMCDIGDEIDIDVVRIINRRDCCFEVMVGKRVQILTSPNQDPPVYNSNVIETGVAAYEFFPPDATVYQVIADVRSSYYTNWGPFTSCTAPCGGGTQNRYRGVVPALDGTTLDASYASLTESKPCNTAPCVISQTSPTQTTSGTSSTKAYTDKARTLIKAKVPETIIDTNKLSDEWILAIVGLAIFVVMVILYISLRLARKIV